MKKFFGCNKFLLTIVLINACLFVGALGFRLGAGIAFVLGGLIIVCAHLSYSVSNSTKAFVLMMVNLLFSVGAGSIISIQLYYHFVSSDFMTLYVGNLFTLGLLLTSVYTIAFVFRKKFENKRKTKDTQDV